MDPEIKRSIRKLFIKLLVFQVVIFFTAVFLSVVFTGHFKQRLGEQLSSASRDSILSGDARQAITSLTSSMARDFSGMSWHSSGEAPGFSVPVDSDRCSRLFCARAAVRLYFDDESRFPAGEMLFYYPRWTPVLWAVIAWGVIVLFSIPIAFFERKRLIRDYNLLLELRINESYSNLAAQVAHDIRSPLAALGAAAKGLEMSAEQRALIAGVVDRMQGIADDLLERRRTPAAGGHAHALVRASEAAEKEPKKCPLGGLIRQVVAEKKAQYKDKSGVKIEFNAQGGELQAIVEPKGFQRLMSNLINNSVEAFAGPGTVLLNMSSSNGKLIIEVRDNGKGIPREILAKLGQKGETHGKTGGNGLGLYYAKRSIESWGGNLLIDSEPLKGTVVKIELPEFRVQRKAVLLDDDMLVHMNWKMSAKAAGVELKAYKTQEEFAADMGTLFKDTRIYIDSELGNGIKGEDIAKELHDKGFTEIIMATGHAPEKFARFPWLKVTGKEPPFNPGE